MAYQKLTSLASFDALLTEIRDFLNDTGDWTIGADLIAADYNPTVTLPDVIPEGRQLIVTNDDCLVGLRSTVAGDGANKLYMAQGIPPYAANNFQDLPNNPGNEYDAGVAQEGYEAFANLGFHPGPFPNTYFFTNDPSTYCHVVVEVQAGVFKHLLFGNLKKYGTWTGGAYYAATHWVSAGAAIDSPGNDNNSVPFDNDSTYQNRTLVHYEAEGTKWINSHTASELNGVTRRKMLSTFRGGFGKAFYTLPESPYSGLIALVPVIVGAVRESDSPDTLRWIGKVPDFAAVNIKNLAPGEEYAIGSDTWVTFPLVAKNGATGQYNSGNYGCAYLKHA